MSIQGHKQVKIIAVTNRKGGVGKSTISTHVAAGLAASGWNVGLVDTDSQGHAGLMLGMPEEDGLFGVLVEKRPLAECVMVVPKERYSTPDSPALGNLYLLPSSVKTYKIPYELDANQTFLFLEILESFAETANLDVLIVDTNPTMSMFDGAVYLATDGFIYVTECERMSFDGITKALDQMQSSSASRRRYLGRDTRVLGIIPNKMRPKTLVHRRNITDLAAAFPGVVWPPLMLSTAWVEAAQLQEPVFVCAPTSQPARDAWAIVERTKAEITAWQTQKTE